MKVVILAGGLGTRLSEETHLRPKPMVEIGGRPILWHILKLYSAYGLHDFIICAGYKGYVIKEYFANYALHQSNVTFDLQKGTLTVHENQAEPWKVTIVDTGELTMTGGRLKRIQPYLEDQDFCLTYGDGIGDINIRELIHYHRKQKVFATLTATKPPARFGALEIFDHKVVRFHEKPQDKSGWINGGFFVLSPRVMDYIEGDNTVWEQAPLERLAKEHQLAAYQHHGFWQPMDTLREKRYLEKLWAEGKAPWIKRGQLLTVDA